MSRKRFGLAIVKKEDAHKVVDLVFEYYKKHKGENNLVLKSINRDFVLIPIYQTGLDYEFFDALLLDIAKEFETFLVGHFDEQGFFWDDY